MDDQPTDLSPEAEPARSTAVDEGAEPSQPLAEGTPAEDAAEPAGETTVETRAQRRARREAVLREPVLPSLTTVPRPVVVVAVVVLAALLVLALLADPVLLAAGLAWAGIVVAWGWPALLGSSSRFGSSLAIGVTGVLAPVAAVATTDEPYLRLVPVALLIGLAVMFGHQMVRRDGRPRLTESIGITSLGLAVVALGTTWLPLSRTSRASDIALLGFVAIAAASLADLRRGCRQAAPVDAAARDAARRRGCAGGRRGGRLARPRRRPPSSASSWPRSRTPPGGCSACCPASARCAGSCRPPRHPCWCPASSPTASPWPSSADRRPAHASVSRRGTWPRGP